MAFVSSEGYGIAFQKYLDAYNKKVALMASPLSDPSTITSAEAELTGDVPIRKLLGYDKLVNDTTTIATDEVAALDAIMVDQLPILLEYFNVKSNTSSIVSFIDTNQAIGAVGTPATNVQVVIWPLV